MSTDQPPPSSPTQGLVANAVFAAVIYTLDAWVLGQGGLIVMAAMVGIGIAMVRGAAASVGRHWSRMPYLLGIIVVWVVAVAGTWASVAFQATVAKRHADEIVVACKQFKADEGHYPAKLGELVPRYLPSVPRAKYTVAFSGFTYMSDPRPEGYGTFLMFVTIAPFMRTSYNFDRDTWTTID